MLRNAPEIILVPKNIFFLKNFELCAMFLECKGSLADGTLVIVVHALLKDRTDRDCCQGHLQCFMQKAGPRDDESRDYTAVSAIRRYVSAHGVGDGERVTNDVQRRVISGQQIVPPPKHRLRHGTDERNNVGRVYQRRKPRP
jgi:hypothetical protein